MLGLGYPFFGDEQPKIRPLWLENPDPDPFGGFTLLRTGPDFYRLMCGRWIDGVGTREKHSDVKYYMDFLCV